MSKIFMMFVCTFYFISTGHSSCIYNETIDLRKVYPNIFRQLAINDQGSRGYCYAHAGTFLIDFMMSKNNNQGVSSRTSVVWGMISGTLQLKRHFDEGGDVCAVVNGITSDKKACVEGILSESKYHELGIEFYRIVVGNFLGHYRRVNSPGNLILMPLTLDDYRNITGLKGAKKEAFDKFHKIYLKTTDLLKSRNFATSTLPTQESLFKLIYEKYINDTYPYELSGAFMQKMALVECKNNFKNVPSIGCSNYSSKNDYHMMDKIDSELQRGMPIGISYCSKFLKNRKYSGRVKYTEARPDKHFWTTKEDCGNHASVVIGRKSDIYGNCFYMIRNSWGKNAVYDWKTSEGDILVGEEELKLNLLETHKLK